MQNQDERSGVLYLLAGIGLGVLIGAVIGLLFAPKSGEEIRGDLSQRLHDPSPVCPPWCALVCPLWGYACGLGG
jgi:hypothetical protein